MATEKRLIDANAADVERISCYYGDHCYIEDVQEWLNEQPTVDAVEVVHGHWCWQGEFRACSKCGSYVEFTETLGASFWKFCPFCGAKMDGDGNAQRYF